MVEASLPAAPQLGSSSGPGGGRGRVVAETPGTQDSVLHSHTLHTLCAGEDVATHQQSARQLWVGLEWFHCVLFCSSCSAAGLLHRGCKVLLVPSCECRRTLVLNTVQDMGNVWRAASRVLQDIVHLPFFVTFCGYTNPYQLSCTALQEVKWWQAICRDVLCYLQLHFRITLPWVLHPISMSLSSFYHILVPCMTLHYLLLCVTYAALLHCRAPVVCVAAAKSHQHRAQCLLTVQVCDLLPRPVWHSALNFMLSHPNFASSQLGCAWLTRQA